MPDAPKPCQRGQAFHKNRAPCRELLGNTKAGQERRARGSPPRISSASQFPTTSSSKSSRSTTSHTQWTSQSKSSFPCSTKKQRLKKRQVYTWIKQGDLIKVKCDAGAGSHCNDRTLGMSATLPAEVEERVVIWINSLRSEGVPVTGRMVRVKAKECYRVAELPLGCFQASQTWLMSFLRRHRLAIRRRTHEGQKTPADAEQVASNFGREVQQCMQQLSIGRVFNADQTGMRIHLLHCKLLVQRSLKKGAYPVHLVRRCNVTTSTNLRCDVRDLNCGIVHT